MADFTIRLRDMSTNDLLEGYFNPPPGDIDIVHAAEWALAINQEISRRQNKKPEKIQDDDHKLTMVSKTVVNRTWQEEELDRARQAAVRGQRIYEQWLRRHKEKINREIQSDDSDVIGDFMMEDGRVYVKNSIGDWERFSCRCVGDDCKCR